MFKRKQREIAHLVVVSTHPSGAFQHNSLCGAFLRKFKSEREERRYLFIVNNNMRFLSLLLCLAIKNM
jgi:hypothetical protein